MQAQHQEVFKAGNALLEQGYSVIPVRDKDHESKGKIYPKKSPFYGWKKCMDEPLTPGMFFSQLEKTNTTWIALVLGKVSKRVIAIDIDNKHWLGVEHKLFSALKDLYAPLWKKLRIHQTQSGGFHIPFMVPESMEILRSKKLAYKEGAKEAGIEMKGEGGFIVIPPSEGYSLFKKNDIPLLTQEEIAVMMAIIEDINEKKTIKKERVKTQKRDSEYYATTPFDDFNHSDQGSMVIEKYGWKFEKENAHFIHFTRGGKKGGVSASFNKEKCYYHIFTTSDEQLEGNENYTPSYLVMHYEKWNGSELFSWLTDNGFGKAHKLKEQDRARKLAQHKGDMPGNFSEEAKVIYKETTDDLKKSLPYGEFWKYGGKGELKLSRSKLYTICSELGFRTINEDLYRIENEKFLSTQTNRELQDALVKYVFCEDEDDYDDILDLLEKFFEKSTNFTIGRLEMMDEDAILCDDRDHCFKTYQNGVVQITSDGYELLPYEEIDQYVYTDRILKRDFVKSDKKGRYSEFIDRAVGFDEYVKGIIGYLSHEWKDETTAYIIALTEMVPDPKEGGGSGKNVFMSLLENLTSICNVNGSQLQYDERFFQSWNMQKLMVLSDVPKNFDFTFLKEPSSGSITWRRLFKNPINVPVYNTPKLVVLTNYSYEVTDGGVKRRVIPLEFSDYFTRNGGVDTVFGCHFPKGWKGDDWEEFDNIMADSVRVWLSGECKLKSRKLSDTGWSKQFAITYGGVINGIIEEYFSKWKRIGSVPVADLKADLQVYYDSNDINIRYRPSRMKLNNALAEWCKKNDMDFDKNKNVSTMGISSRCYVFGNGEGEDPAREDLPF